MYYEDKEFNFEGKAYKKLRGYRTYGITSDGFILDLRTGKFSRGAITHKGYRRASLLRLGKRKNFRLPRLVGKYWVENPSNLPYILHKDNDRANDDKSNLKWGTHEENMEQAKKDKRFFRRLMPIKQLDMEGNLIEEWPSPIQAAQALDLNNRNICGAAKGKRFSAGGFRWEYVKETII